MGTVGNNTLVSNIGDLANQAPVLIIGKADDITFRKIPQIAVASRLKAATGMAIGVSSPNCLKLIISLSISKTCVFISQTRNTPPTLASPQIHKFSE